MATEEVMEEKKTRTRKAAAKKVVDVAAAEVENAVQTVKKRATRSTAAAVFVQYGSSELEVSAVVEAAKADYAQTNTAAAKDVRVYIKPEENAAYYVINGVEGKITL